ncbi:MAG: hypothetical protein PWQ15_1160 [Methanobacterium sp.]|jgi:hypothetical protein|uniref:hypothetical protein n=1 Tax=Methanobacterium sp. TaxID=2164 RepID=UPI0024AAC35C|nr:hypothetical protein [Methanobacterium sp.]MDI3550058.1 hypothetical protein [Methanobacterium sp.]
MVLKDKIKIFCTGLTLALFILVSVTGASYADVVEPGEKIIPYSYQIVNLQDYPHYVLILHGTPNPSLEVLDSSKFSFYKLSTCYIYAVPSSVYQEVELNKMNETQISEFLKNDNRVARSNLRLEGLYDTVNKENPLESALIILKIYSIEGNTLNIQKEKIIYTYSNNQSIEKPFLNQNQTPEPPFIGPSWDFYFYFVGLPLLALAVILFIFIRRR